MKLTDIKSGESCSVINTDNSKRIGRYLLEAGLVYGTAVTVIKTAPAGDPIEIRYRNTSLVLRKKDANIIEVVKL